MRVPWGLHAHSQNAHAGALRKHVRPWAQPLKLNATEWPTRSGAVWSGGLQQQRPRLHSACYQPRTFVADDNTRYVGQRPLNVAASAMV